MAKWTEPFTFLVLDEEGMTPKLIKWALKKNVLSAKAIGSVEKDIMAKGAGWGEELVQIDDEGNCSTILELSLRLLEQSYSLACSRFDEPELAIISVDVMCSIANFCPDTKTPIDTLLRVAQSNEKASARVAHASLSYPSLENRLPLEPWIDSYLSYHNEDFRYLIQTKRIETAYLMADVLLRAGPMFTTGSGSMELMYLMAEFLFSIGEHSSVIELPISFSDAWQFSNGKEEHLKERRRIQFCIARSLEATGQLQRAQLMYNESGYDESAKLLDPCIAGERCYWTQQGKMNILGNSSANDVTARELQDGTIAVFLTRAKYSEKGDEDQAINFYTVKPGSDFTLRNETLPAEGKKWKKVKVVPESKTEPLRVLVAPWTVTDQSSSEERMEDLALMMLNSGSTSVSTSSPIELWEYGESSWNKIITRGNVPDSKALTSLGGRCEQVKDKIILISGISRRRDNSGVFMLDTDSREWLQVPHPYVWETPLSTGARGLPSFLAASSASIAGHDMLAMLRQRYPIANRRGGENEVVPKFALDLLGVAEPQGSTNRPSCWWNIDVPLRDRSGYIAYNSSVCTQIGKTLVVIGSSSYNLTANVEDNWPNLAPPDGIHISVDALQLENLEWRGTYLHNSWLLGEKSNEFAIANSPESECCYVVAISETGLRLLCLHNTNAFESSFTKPISAKKTLSKKNTLSYRIKKAQKESVVPLRVCASCNIFEAEGVDFSCCSRCRGPFYCSKTCQTLHWKAAHKKECKPFVR
jgi:hypothetical protein